MPVMTPNANTPNVMLVTPMKVYFASKVATSAPQTSMIFEVVMIDGVVGTGS
jgi:hypothetical protein